uniref:Uncharacterized protein n=1 Tax=Zea mays TaxID=4577 RepID=C4J7V2_MAIZE|nr:unknown [Zea mays]
MTALRRSWRRRWSTCPRRGTSRSCSDGMGTWIWPPSGRMPSTGFGRSLNITVSHR